MQITQKQAIERGATHFIEQYRIISDESDISYTPRTRIEYLNHEISNTEKLGFKTVAVFLIKPKKKIKKISKKFGR